MEIFPSIYGCSMHVDLFRHNSYCGALSSCIKVVYPCKRKREGESEKGAGTWKMSFKKLQILTGAFLIR